MSGPQTGPTPPELPRRFYTEVTVEERPEGYAVLLDGRPMRTPGRSVIAVPSAELAEAVAGEWGAQGERVDPATMPLTRLVNTALDGVAQAARSVREDIVRFASTDLICYRADGPEGLVTRQSELWDPVVAWAKEALDVDLVLGEGVMHVAQSDEAMRRVGEAVGEFDVLSLTALHAMTSLTGSAILALAVARGRIGADEAWAAAHVDEDWQISQWGEDAEAMRRRRLRWEEMAAAARVVALAGP